MLAAIEAQRGAIGYEIQTRKEKEMDRLPQVSAGTGLPSKQKNWSVQAVLDDRLMLSEAIKIASDLLSLFPSTKGDVSDGFIGGLASVLMEYPRIVAVRCSDPRSWYCA